MLTKVAMERARRLDRAYGGDGNCSHDITGPSPMRPPPQDTRPPKVGEQVRRYDEKEGRYIWVVHT